MFIGIHVKYPLFFSDFNYALLFCTDVRKIINYQIWKSIPWKPSCSMRMDRQMDGETWRS